MAHFTNAIDPGTVATRLATRRPRFRSAPTSLLRCAHAFHLQTVQTAVANGRCTNEQRLLDGS